MPPPFGKCPPQVLLGASGMLVISGIDQLQFKLLFMKGLLKFKLAGAGSGVARDGSLYSNAPVPDLQLNVVNVLLPVRLLLLLLLLLRFPWPPTVPSTLTPAPPPTLAWRVSLLLPLEPGADGSMQRDAHSRAGSWFSSCPPVRKSKTRSLPRFSEGREYSDRSLKDGLRHDYESSEPRTSA